MNENALPSPDTPVEFVGTWQLEERDLVTSTIVKAEELIGHLDEKPDMMPLWVCIHVFSGRKPVYLAQRLRLSPALHASSVFELIDVIDQAVQSIYSKN